MPGTLQNPIVYFPLKFVCYSFVGWVLRKIYKQDGINPFLFGILRVLIGLGAGLLLMLAMSPIHTVANARLIDFIWLFFTRVLVWAAMIWIIFERKAFFPVRFIIAVALSVGFSFGIDAAYWWMGEELPGGWLLIGMC